MTPAGMVISVIIGLVVNECCEISPWAALKLVKWSAHRRYADSSRADARAEELSALIEDRPGKLFKLLTACGFAIEAFAVLARQAAMSRNRSSYQERFDALPSGQQRRLITSAGLLGCLCVGASAVVLTLHIDSHLAALALAELALALVAAVLIATMSRVRGDQKNTSQKFPNG